ncbi:hypothetical protein ESCO_003939 [Escovopsis weberi]|uniref:Uncharacterized protein n=1 Tax=Escovopsis weberi TaxID=150374 RepID=A0A0M8N9I6_ESCWE|nr:hypothetical protein ESCO_003939 [Escovopsis weberi]
MSAESNVSDENPDRDMDVWSSNAAERSSRKEGILGNPDPGSRSMSIESIESTAMMDSPTEGT